MSGDLGAMRRTYALMGLDEQSLGADPLAALRTWLDQAIAAGLLEPNAMCIATAQKDGAPSARMVLLRGIDARGLVFYTSYLSRKGRQISENPLGAALFYWAALERQVRVEGAIEPVSDEESDAYFASRPRGHQLSAWASDQSEEVESRELLQARTEDYRVRFEGETVPRPHSWGGYVLAPQRMEFWQGRPDRLHDRLEYRRLGSKWSTVRLSP